MPARAIATGTVSFGLVSIPVKLYSSSVPSSGVHFNMLHAKCGNRVKQQYTCPVDNGEVVDRSEMVKGYEFQKGKYVTFTEEEIEALEEEATQAVEITEFLPIATVDPVYFDKAYYLGPDKGAEKPYRLLCTAMQKTGRVALAKYAARGKQYLVMLRPHEEHGLVLQQLHYADEVRGFDEVPIADAEVKENELKLAIQLIDQIAHDEFHPESYEDEVKERMLEQIQRKVEGQEITLTQAETPKAQIIDLMDALKASLGGGGAHAANDETKGKRKPAHRVARDEPAPKKKAAKGSKR